MTEPADAPDLADLLEQARGGDETARDELFQRCRNYVGCIARAQVESWLRAKVDASDVIQQTMLEAHRAFDQFRGQTEAEWLAWLRRILNNNAADFVRFYQGTQKRRASREVAIRPTRDDSQAAVCDPRDPGDSPSRLAIQREDELRLADAIAGLSADHQEVIILRNLQRLPFDEVATIMGRSRPAVQMLWMRAVKKLQDAMPD